MKKIILILLIFCCFFIDVKQVEAKTVYNSEIIQDLKRTNDNELLELINTIETQGKISKSEEIYLKIENQYDDKNKRKKPKITKYSKEKYLSEIREEQTRAVEKYSVVESVTTNPIQTSWIKIYYEISDLSSVKKDLINVRVAFRWLTIPVFQFEDVFAVGTDSGFAFDPATLKFVYWPDVNKDYFRTYNYTQSLEDQKRAYLKQNAVGYRFNLVDLSINEKAYNKTYINQGTQYSLSGTPKGILTFSAYMNHDHVNLALFYAHEQIEVFKIPEISVDSSGQISFTGSVQDWETVYDEYQPIIIYNRGENNSPNMATSWYNSNGQWYYYDSDGIMIKGWKQIEGSWYYFGTNGVMRTGWVQVDGKWYYLNSSGIMQVGWQQIEGRYYYLGSDGVMQLGWLQINSKWYYLQPVATSTMKLGQMSTDWQKIDYKVYYFDANGIMKTSSWIQSTSTGKWYYVGADGVMYAGWHQIEGYWYFFNDATYRGDGVIGEMLTGWLTISDYWYYLYPTTTTTVTKGQMAVGWVQVNSKWYYFYSNGRMAVNTTVDGYRLGSDGAMI